MPPRDSSDSYKRFEITFNPRDFEPVTPYSEELKDEYEETKHALEVLRQKEEVIRRRAEELELITQKEETFVRGRKELLQQIEDYLEILEREAIEANRIASECGAAQQCFHHHLTTLRNLRPEAKDKEKLKNELEHALRQIKAAEEDVAGVEPLIEHIAGRRNRRPEAASRNSGGREIDFIYWLKAGLIFTLPLLAVAIIVASFFIFIR